MDDRARAAAAPLTETTLADRFDLNKSRVLLNGAPKFVGTVGLDSDRVAVKLTKKIPLEEESNAKSHGR